MNELRIDVDGDRTWFLPGETVTGRAVWRLEDDAESVDLRVFWYTSGKGTEDVAIIDSVHAEAAGTAGELGFSFPLPNGPYSFSGSLITLTWALEIVALPLGTTQRIDLIVAPTPVEIRLDSLGRPPFEEGAWTTVNFKPE